MSLEALFMITSLSFGLPPGLLDAVCLKESRHNPQAYLASDGDGTPSYGLCQVKKKTCDWMGVKGNLMQPSVNLRCAARYLGYQLKRYKGNYVRALVAYNKGHSTSDRGNRYSSEVLEHWRSIQQSKERRAYAGRGFEACRRGDR